jgi:hypothetical protein
MGAVETPVGKIPFYDDLNIYLRESSIKTIPKRNM